MDSTVTYWTGQLAKQLNQKFRQGVYRILAFDLSIDITIAKYFHVILIQDYTSKNSFYLSPKSY